MPSAPLPKILLAFILLVIGTSPSVRLFKRLSVTSPNGEFSQGWFHPEHPLPKALISQRRRDSNSWRPFQTLNGFQDRPIKPLWHPSKLTQIFQRTLQIYKSFPNSQNFRQLFCYLLVGWHLIAAVLNSTRNFATLSIWMDCDWGDLLRVPPYFLRRAVVPTHIQIWTSSLANCP